MKARRRRARRSDPLATPGGVRSICRILCERCPALIPNSERQLVKLLEAVRHIERRPATDTKRGRPPAWPRETLLEVASHLRAVLERETLGRISLQSFTGQYLRLLRFPPDVQAALERGDLNLGEAAQLARLTAQRLDVSAQKATALRAEVLRSHVMLKGTERTIRARVRELLGEVVEVTSQTIVEAVQKADDLLEVDPADKRHLFYEEMKRLFYAMREIQPEDIDDESLNEFMNAADGLSNALYAIELKRQKRERKVRKLII
jgi:hypothetical protein